MKKKVKSNDIKIDRLIQLVDDFKKEYGDLYKKYQDELDMSNSKTTDMIILNNFFNEFQDVANDEKWMAIFEDSEASSMPMPEAVQCQFLDKLFNIKNLDVLEELDIDETPWFTGYIEESQIPYFQDVLSGHFVEDSKPKKVKDKKVKDFGIWAEVAAHKQKLLKEKLLKEFEKKFRDFLVDSDVFTRETDITANDLKEIIKNVFNQWAKGGDASYVPLKDELTEEERQKIFFSPNYDDEKSIVDLKLDLLRFFNNNKIKNYTLSNNDALMNSGIPELEDLADESNAIEQASYEYFKENYNEAFNMLVNSFGDWRNEFLQDLLEDLSLEGIISVNQDIYPDSVRKIAEIRPIYKNGQLIRVEKTGEEKTVHNSNPKADIGVVYNIPVDAADKYQAKHMGELKANQKRRELVRRTK